MVKEEPFSSSAIFYDKTKPHFYDLGSRLELLSLTEVPWAREFGVSNEWEYGPKNL